jgi:hypothetical protein
MSKTKRIIKQDLKEVTRLLKAIPKKPKGRKKKDEWWEKLSNHIVLPEFVTLEEPKPDATLHINYRKKAFTVTLTSTNTGEVLHQGEGVQFLDDLYNKEQVLQKYQITYHPSTDATMKPVMDGWRQMPKPYKYVWMQTSAQTFHNLVADDYYEYLKAAKHFLRHPKNFEAAHSWLTKHPAFWLNDNRGIQDIFYIYAFKPEVIRHKGKTVVRLEVGSAVEPERTQHYFDYKLAAEAKTYEKAVIKLAAKMLHQNNIDGSDRIK